MRHPSGPLPRCSAVGQARFLCTRGCHACTRLYILLPEEVVPRSEANRRLRDTSSHVIRSDGQGVTGDLLPSVLVGSLLPPLRTSRSCGGEIGGDAAMPSCRVLAETIKLPLISSTPSLIWAMFNYGWTAYAQPTAMRMAHSFPTSCSSRSRDHRLQSCHSKPSTYV